MNLFEFGIIGPSHVFTAISRLQVKVKKTLFSILKGVSLVVSWFQTFMKPSFSEVQKPKFWIKKFHTYTFWHKIFHGCIIENLLFRWFQMVSVLLANVICA